MPAAEPRSGTPTFLFTDIEGSTKRWEADRDAMSAALARHDAILCGVIEVRGGRVFKTVGDAFCSAFAAVSDAARAALEAQHALTTEDWAAFGPDFEALRVRMAIHTGEAEQRGGDFFGPALNRVARLLATSHGGQVLLSGAAAELLDAAPSSTGEVFELKDLGHHHLKDLARPLQVHQLLIAGLTRDFPPIRSLDTHPNNLPRQGSTFVGRARELTELAEQLERHRLLTLVGVGGSGKTRLALQVAADGLHRYPDGAWFVDLAPLSRPELVTEAVAAILDPRDSATVADLLAASGTGRATPYLPGEAERAVAARARGRHMLVVLDNCEHLVDACAQMAATLARHAPGVTILATSRVPLRIEEEQLWLLDPLATPDPTTVAQAADPVLALGGFDAVRLFLDRAEAVQPGFEPNAANAPALAEICHRLDGIPLALELAAARVRLLPPAEMARRLDDRFRLLVGGSRTALPRQQTLRATIDWSYELLTPIDRLALQRLSVLAGRLPLAGALTVIGDAPSWAPDPEGGTDSPEAARPNLDKLATLDALDSLIEKSLLVVEERDGQSWFRMLDTIRAYAAERLHEAEGGEEPRERLLDWLLQHSSEARDVVAGAEMDAWNHRLELLLPDLRASLRWSGSQEASVAARGARLAARLWWFWGHPGQVREGLENLAGLVGAAGEAAEPADLAMIAYVQALLHNGIGQRHEAIEAFRQARRRFAELGDRKLEAWALQDEGHPWLALGDLDRAEACFREAVELKRVGAAPTDLSVAVDNLGEIYRLRGKLDLALACSEEAIALLPEPDRSSTVALWPLCNHGHILLRLGQLGRGEAALERALLIAVEHGADWNLPTCLSGLAGAAASRGDGARAARLFGTVEARLEEQGERLPIAVAADGELHFERARTLLDGLAWDSAYAEGRAMDREQAVTLALEGTSE